MVEYRNFHQICQMGIYMSAFPYRLNQVQLVVSRYTHIDHNYDYKKWDTDNE